MDTTNQLLRQILGALDADDAGSDPALDPRLWANAGGSVTLAPVAATAPLSNRIAQLMLPRPMCVAVQLGLRDGTAVSYNSVSDQISAIVHWGSGRSTQQATVDIGPGTTFTLAAAQSISITVVYRPSGGTGTITVECTMAPASAANPLPAFRTHTFQTINAGLDLGGLQTIPAWARRMWVYCDNMNAATNLEIQLATQGGLIVTDVLNPPSAPILIPRNANSYDIVNNSLTNLTSVIAAFELVL